MASSLQNLQQHKLNSSDLTSLAPTKKRKICSRCNRPVPRTCICEGLPDSPVSLQKCRVLVLQHPHEAKRKNRSLPLIELCLNDNTKSNINFKTVVARRFGDKVDENVMKLLKNDSGQDILLVYPCQNALSLQQGLKLVEQRRKFKNEKGSTLDEKIIVLFLDATWKYAREMDLANLSTNQYPEHLIRVALRPDGTKEDSIIRESLVNAADGLNNPPAVCIDRPDSFQPRRFDIRTPPSANHLSTGECIAWVVAVIENAPSLYETLTKPMDLMVKKWHSCSDGSSKKRSFQDGGEI